MTHFTGKWYCVISQTCIWGLLWHKFKCVCTFFYNMQTLIHSYFHVYYFDISNEFSSPNCLELDYFVRLHKSFKIFMAEVRLVRVGFWWGSPTSVSCLTDHNSDTIRTLSKRYLAVYDVFGLTKYVHYCWVIFTPKTPNLKV